MLQSNLEETSAESLERLFKLARFEDDSHASFSKVSIEDVLVEAYEKIESLANKNQFYLKTIYKMFLYEETVKLSRTLCYLS